MTSKPTLGVGMVGYAFMGQAHSQAWRTVNAAFDLPYTVDMAAIAGRSEDKVKAAAEKFGWRSYETDWRALIERDDIGLVDVCSPGGNHAEVAIAALAAGKHVLCEKPLANTVEEAREMVKAAEAAAQNGVRSMVGFNYRRVPAAAFARQLVLDGKLGKIRHVRAVYLQDWITDPEFPLVWRLKKDKAGSGALGDIGVPHRRPHPVRHRPDGHRRQRADRDLHQAAPAGGLHRGAGAAPARPSAARSPSTTRRCSSPGWPAARWRRTRRPGSRPAARTACG